MRLILRIGRRHGGVDPATHIEIAGHGHSAGLTGIDQIVEDLVGDGFMKRALVAVRPQVKLKRFEFDAKPIGYVGDTNRGEVRLAGSGADAGELRALHIDFKFSTGPRIGKGF